MRIYLYRKSREFITPAVVMQCWLREGQDWTIKWTWGIDQVSKMHTQ